MPTHTMIEPPTMFYSWSQTFSLKCFPTLQCTKVAPDEPKTREKAWRIILALNWIRFCLYILGNKPVTLSLYVDWINVLSYLIRPYDSRPLLTCSVWMVFGSLKTFFLIRFRNLWLLPGFTTFQTVLCKPSNSSGWYVWSTCFAETRTDLRRCFSPVPEQLTDDGSVITKWCNLFFYLFFYLSEALKNRLHRTSRTFHLLSNLPLRHFIFIMIYDLTSLRPTQLLGCGPLDHHYLISLF